MPPGGKRPGAGQPPHKPRPEQRKLVEELSAVGIPQAQIAIHIGVSEPTLRKAYRTELDQGSIKANAAIGKRLFQLAMSGNVAALIFWSKVRMGWSEKQRVEVSGADGGPIKSESTHRFFTPDFTEPSDTK